jgi:GTP-binding protein
MMSNAKPFIKNPVFRRSSRKLDECPETARPEFAFTGRSNVGKSSLINLLTGRRKLALTSATPGKTRLINHFLMDGKWYLVDLPGYGYAKRSKAERKQFGSLIESYVLGRKNLSSLFVLVDSRIDPQPIDIDFINWLGTNGIPFSIVLTKTDKPRSKELEKNINAIQETLLQTWEELPPFFLTSAVKKTGQEELLHYMEEIINKSI